MRAAVLLVVACGATVAAGCGGTRTVTRTVTVAGAPAPRPGTPRETVLFGHVRSLRRKGAAFELRFDPAWWLSGVAAERAAVEDGVLRPGQPVPNDHYVVEEGHRTLTYVVPVRARVSIVTRGPSSTAVTVAELAEILAGHNPRHRPLFVPGNHLGFWIRVGSTYPNAVIAIDQQYQP